MKRIVLHNVMVLNIILYYVNGVIYNNGAALHYENCIMLHYIIEITLH